MTNTVGNKKYCKINKAPSIRFKQEKPILNNKLDQNFILKMRKLKTTLS